MKTYDLTYYLYNEYVMTLFAKGRESILVIRGWQLYH